MNFISSDYQRFTRTPQEAASKEVPLSTASTFTHLTTGEDQSNTSGMPELQALSIPADKIQIGRQLGKGSYGTVYEGNWDFRKVAVKCYEGTRLPERVAEEVRHEVTVMLRLDHECLVRFFGLVQEENHPAMLVMEYGAKGSLYDYLHSKSEISWAHRLSMGEDLSRGLAYLHDKNIVHRDIKSLNIVLDKTYQAKWCDFGLAHLKLHSTTTTKGDASGGGRVGTLRWMSPELFNDDNPMPSRASDIWALGMVFFELASREIPYKNRREEMQVMSRIMSGKGEEVPEECQKEAPDFGALMQRCWTVRNERPTAAQIAAEIGVLVERLNMNHAQQTSAGREQKAIQPPPVPVANRAPAPVQAPVKAMAPIQKAGVPTQVAKTPVVVPVPEGAFGKAQWAKYFGDVGIEPPLPKDIQTILNSACPVFSGKKVGETHMLVLIPKIVNGKPLTLKTLGELAKAPTQGQPTQYRYYNYDITKEEWNRSTDQSHWVLMTKDVIEGSRNKKYADQQSLVADLARRTGKRYEVPKALDIATCLLMRYVSTGEWLYSDSPDTHTRCQEKDKDGDPMIVGGFSSAGLIVGSSSSDFENFGVAACRLFGSYA